MSEKNFYLLAHTQTVTTCIAFTVMVVHLVLKFFFGSEILLNWFLVWLWIAVVPISVMLGIKYAESSGFHPVKYQVSGNADSDN